MRKKGLKRISSGVAVSAYFLERGDVSLGVLVAGLGISSPDSIGLRRNVVGKFFRQAF
jgi:hypothetical protein